MNASSASAPIRKATGSTSAAPKTPPTAPSAVGEWVYRLHYTISRRRFRKGLSENEG